MNYLGPFLAFFFICTTALAKHDSAHAPMPPCPHAALVIEYQCSLKVAGLPHTQMRQCVALSRL